MSVFTYQPSFVPPPSYSTTKIQPPPYSKPTSNSGISLPSSLNPINGIKSLTRSWTHSSIESSTLSIPLTSSSTPSITVSSPSPYGSPLDRDSPTSPVPKPPPTYAPIKTSPKPSTKPPAYAASESPRSSTETRANQRSESPSVSRQHVLPSKTTGLACDYEDDDWETMRWREERRRDEEDLRRRQEEDRSGCCAWWWSVGASPLPWAAYYVF